MSSPNAIQHLKAQIEFYFSDANLRKDGFLSKKLRENGGWIDISVLCGFNKVKEITSDVNVLKEVISSISFLELNGAQVRRKAPVAKKSHRELEKSTLRVEPITAETTIESLHQMFDKYGNVVYIGIPKNKEHELIGYALIEFEKRDDAKNALTGFSKSEIETSSSSSSHPHLRVTSLAKWNLDRKKEHKKKEHIYSPGLIVYFDNGGAALEKVQLSKILNSLYPSIQFEHIELEPNTNFGFIRFSNPGDAQKVVEEVVGERGLKINEQPLNLRILAGKEEKDYWEMIAKKKKANKKKQREEKNSKKKEKGKKRKDFQNGGGSNSNSNDTTSSSESEDDLDKKKLKESAMDE